MSIQPRILFFTLFALLIIFITAILPFLPFPITAMSMNAAMSRPFANTEQLNLIRTKPIKFIIGCENAEFYLQPGLVSRLSAPVDALVRSGVNGSDGHYVTWDIDVELFLRLVQFIFTGSYTCLMGKPDEDTGIDVLSKAETFQLPYSLASYELQAKLCTLPTHTVFGNPQANHRCSPSGTRKAISAFMSTYVHGDDHSCFGHEPKSQVDDALLCHARMWAFAEEYAIQRLADLALSRLAYELAHWTISATTFVPAFSKLVHQTYKLRSKTQNSLRALVASYAARVGRDIAALDTNTS